MKAKNLKVTRAKSIYKLNESISCGFGFISDCDDVKGRNFFKANDRDFNSYLGAVRFLEAIYYKKGKRIC